MKEIKLKSFEFATDLTKQLITLATVLIGISITFFEKFENNSNKWVLIGSWLSLFISIILGILTLMALTGSLGKIEDEKTLKDANIYTSNITNFSMCQIIAFLLGILMLIGYSSFCSTSKEIKDKEEIKIEQIINNQYDNP